MEEPVDWSAKVELFEQIRREYEFGVGTVLGVAKKLGVHRRMVREALANAVPARRKKAERKRPKLAGVIPFIDAILEGDARAPRKQRHTAHRIYQRIRVEQSGCEVSESTVRRYVREKKEALGLIRRETSCRRAMSGAAKRKRISTRPMPIWAGSGRSCTSSRCAAWRAEAPFIERTSARRSKRFWKRTSGL